MAGLVIDMAVCNLAGGSLLQIYLGPKTKKMIRERAGASCSTQTEKNIQPECNTIYFIYHLYCRLTIYP